MVEEIQSTFWIDYLKASLFVIMTLNNIYRNAKHAFYIPWHQPEKCKLKITDTSVI